MPSIIATSASSEIDAFIVGAATSLPYVIVKWVSDLGRLSDLLMYVY